MTEPGPLLQLRAAHSVRGESRQTFASAPGTTGAGASRRPLQQLNGTITPNGLHFERDHSDIPDVNPAAHRLLIHGLVKRPLIFSLKAVARYPLKTRVAFIECGGNIGA
jgi:sulfane dehydrogenase subunit SoxC